MKNEIRVFQVDIKINLLKNVSYQDTLYSLGSFLNHALSLSDETLDLHLKKEFKGYCFSNLKPMEPDKVYKEGQVYSFSVRTVKKELAQYLTKVLPEITWEGMKGIVAKSMLIPKIPIEKLYTLNYCIIKNDSGYWKKNLTLEEFEKRLNDNCQKKYTFFTEKEIEQTKKFYSHIQFLNRKVIAMHYKDISLLGDKIELCIDADPVSQEVAYMLLGVGLGENNSSMGAGYVNYKTYQ